MDRPVTRAIGVMGKVPLPNLVKTRLVPPLSPEQAASLYGAFLADALACATSVSNARVALFHLPTRDLSPLLDIVPPGVACVVDRGTDLGEGMHRAFLKLFGGGAAQAVVIGSDLPTLPSSVLEDAFRALEQGQDVAIGPAADGGYYLIGLRCPQPTLFNDMVWSTVHVLEQTLDRARAAGLTVTLVEEWYDVDNEADLEKLATDLQRNPDLRANATRHVLATMTGCIQDPGNPDQADSARPAP